MKMNVSRQAAKSKNRALAASEQQMAIWQATVNREMINTRKAVKSEDLAVDASGHDMTIL